MRFKITIKLILVILAISALTTYFTLDRMIVYFFSKACNLDIYYRNFKNESFRQFVFTGLTVVDMKRGVGLSSEYAKLKLKKMRRFFKNMTLEFEMHNVRFIKNGEDSKERYSDLSGLTLAPFASRWRYEDVSGRINIVDEGIEIDDLKAAGADIKLSLKGTTLFDSTLKSNIIIFFSERLLADIPEELSGIILREEPDGWKSLSVEVTGDYKSPSIQLSGKQFRLNIKGITPPQN